MNRHKTIHIGTSGWHYAHWEGVFYPAGMAKEEYLRFYSGRFHSVEINSTFYRLPQKTTLSSWRDAVPQRFIFSVKASRYITHMKKLKDPQKPVVRFLKRMEALGDKLGPVLFQLPPRWRVNLERLDAFLKVLPSGFRYAFEFRDPSWCQDRVYGLLSEKEAAFCIYDYDRNQSPKQVTAGFVYIRLHGPEGPYKGLYDSRSLYGWAGDISSWAGEGKEVFCYFDNDQSGFAVRNALDLDDMIGEN